MFWEDKVCWISGASSGIGEALAYEIHRRGGRVILSARSGEKLQKLTASWPDRERILILPLDVSRHEDFPAAVEKALAAWGVVDILICNAGISQRSLAAQTDLSAMKQVMDTNFLGSAGLCRELLPHMIRRKQGIIAPVSSVAGKFATPLRSSYCASKMAIQGYFDSVRAECHSQGIRVSMIIPGFVKTRISINALDGQGGHHGVMDPNQEKGIPPAQAAREILRGLEKNKREIHTGITAKVHLALLLNRFFPGLLNRMLRRVKVK